MFLLLAPIMLFFPIIGVPMVIFAASNTQKYKYSMILMLGVFFGIMGFYFVPKIDTDLVRYFSNYVDVMRGNSFSWIFSNSTTSEKVFIVQQLLFFIPSRFNNDQVLPFLTIFIAFTNGFYIVTDYSRERKIGVKTTYAMILLFIMSMTFALMANNTRNIVAVSFLSVALYRDVYRQNRGFLTFIFYFCALSTHMATVPLIAVRIVFSLFNNLKKLNVLRVLAVVILLVVTTAVLVKTGLLAMITDKGASYLVGGDSGTELQQWFATADSSVVEVMSKYISMFFCFVFELIILATYRTSRVDNLKSESSETLQKSKSLLSLMLIYNLLVIFIAFTPGTTWFRFYFVPTYFVSIIFYISTKQKNRNAKLLITVFWMGFIVWNIILQIYRLNQQTYLIEFLKNVWIAPLFGVFN